MSQESNVKHNQVEIITWDPRYRDDFTALNEAWVREFFEMEENDHKHLADPERTIIEPGGDIVFLIENGRCVGTCALLARGPGELELAKMAVLDSERGRGLGDILMRATLNRARELGARRVVLLSNTTLAPAIGLYRKHGFKTVREGTHPDYARTNIVMEIHLAAAD